MALVSVALGPFVGLPSAVGASFDKDLATLKEPLTIEPIGIALPPGDAQLRSLIDSYLMAFEGTGLLEQLRKKWLENSSWLAALP